MTNRLTPAQRAAYPRTRPTLAERDRAQRIVDRLLPESRLKDSTYDRAIAVIHAYRTMPEPVAVSTDPSRIAAPLDPAAIRLAEAYPPLPPAPIPGTHQELEYLRRLKSGKMGSNGNSPMSGPLFSQVHANGSAYARYGRTGRRA